VRSLSKDHEWYRMDLNESNLIANLTRPVMGEIGRNKWVKAIEVDEET